MNILITNDDGIFARGIRELVTALNESGMTVYVCAPEGQRSATGHGITMSENMQVEDVPLEGAEKAFHTTGLPADCVKIGMELMRRGGVKIDAVFSGINHGGNLGTDTIYSGTVAGALEGTLCGVPAVAVSVDSHEASHFDLACEYAVQAALTLEEQIAAGTADPKVALNINVPNLPKDQVKGLRYTRLGEREYDEEFAPADGGQNMTVPGEFKYFGTPVIYEGLPDDIDVVALQDGYASISPIHVDLTKHDMIEAIKTWGLEPGKR